MTTSHENFFNNRICFVLSVLYALFVVYITIIPFDFTFSWSYIKWRLRSQLHIPFIYNNGSYASLKDTIQNIVFFIPFGFFALWSCTKLRRRNIFYVVVSGLMLSLFVEILQLFVRHRYSSINDLITNTFGTLVGSVCAYFLYSKIQVLGKIFYEKCKSPQLIFLLMSSLLLVVISISPFDVSFSFTHFKNKLRSCTKHFFSINAFDLELMQFMYYSIWICAFNLYLQEKNKYHGAVSMFFGCIVATCLEFSQLLILSRMPQFQDLVVAFVAIVFGTLITKYIKRCTPIVISILIAFATYNSFICHTLSPFVFADQWRTFNWLPFIAQYEISTMVVWSHFLDNACMFLALGFAHSYAKRSLILPYLFIALFAFSLEFCQGFIVDRYPDITDIMGVVCGYMVGRFVGTKVSSFVIENSSLPDLWEQK
ncbi:VanZ family protein [Candidatus Uabimicrobium amorphum]|uniref:Transposase n=1 Tax=Uabimicrobium amorphum TaxID=2596890 RepID=A0A5S9IR08_UABAM|nr:VanZ family protein [Candidatus Uabimicrobium amorphum]BBM85095.1 transposase [Candidatus Uabimicrobium amorphum]